MARRQTDETGVEPAIAVSKVTLAQIESMAALHYLSVLGGFACQDDETLPKGTRSVLMLGPREPGFWAHIRSQPEWNGAPDPMDRWSRRVIGTMACDLGAKALFPFGGPPWQPFYSMALRTGRVWESPVRILVQADQGLLVSFRGALAVRDVIDLPPVVPRPCDACAKPCLAACPVAALTADGYDVPACHQYLDTETGANCMNFGCGVRRACPLSESYARLPEQSAYHMGQFHK